MTQMPAKLQERADRKSAKRDGKMLQIADSAIIALQELGYANTSLRDIAAKSDMSLGILHYYFRDRSELIIYCVRVYKQKFVEGILDALETALGRDDVIAVLSNALALSITRDAMTHRLWYDIRNQAVFDQTFRPVVAEIDALLVSIVARAFERSNHDAPETIAIHYAALDGVFHFLMHDQLTNEPRSMSDVEDIFNSVLRKLL